MRRIVLQDEIYLHQMFYCEAFLGTTFRCRQSKELISDIQLHYNYISNDVLNLKIVTVTPENRAH